MTHQGSCLCGEVAFQVDCDFNGFYLCHCSRCRKDTGSAHGANLFAADAAFRWLKGQEYVTTFKLADTLHARSFCSKCGSALPLLNEDSQSVVVPAGSLDNDPGVQPTAHIFMGSKAAWDVDLNDVTAYEELLGSS
ncbi:hypothetical protein FHR99_000143 [Litorivivens lipolytica]|uniref:CENP-V/GFA domain-containing protein n=1 Tax=Litorivivens lipolytica TaxID=1524264 RepID=A0A7W4W1W1_9GAMM|nr:GFA family protein [Litorivivens lipolytica]MBB3045907.1 hypothetical protein [Litorivivens lipolytica]